MSHINQKCSDSPLSSVKSLLNFFGGNASKIVLSGFAGKRKMFFCKKLSIEAIQFPLTSA